MGRKKSRCNLAGVVSLSVLFCIVSFFMIVDASHQSKRTQRRESLDNNRVNLSAGNFLVEWNVDKNAGSIEFILNVTVDEKGWIFFGFMPISINSSTKPSGIEDSKGDFVVTWLLPASNDRETLVRNLTLVTLFRVTELALFQVLSIYVASTHLILISLLRRRCFFVGYFATEI